MGRQQQLEKEARWGGLLAAFAQQDSGSAAVFCARHQVSVAQFYYQRRKALVRQSSRLPQRTEQAFREYALAPLATLLPAAPVASGVSLRVGDVLVEVAPGFDAAVLRAVLSCCR